MKQVRQNGKYRIKGYYLHKGEKVLNASNVFVVLLNPAIAPMKVDVYCPIGQHGEADRDYVTRCKRITLEQYKEASKGIYTPEEYLLGEGVVLDGLL